MDALTHAKEHLKKSRETDRDKDSIAHLESAVAGLIGAIDPADSPPIEPEDQDGEGDETDEDDE